jgi:D-2-hydroxyacid dehydrogenase (NADP+)
MGACRRAYSVRSLIVLLLCSCVVTAQTKKILVLNGNPAMVRELQSASPKARIVAVTQATVMQEIADADGYIGEVTPAQVRAAKNLRWVQITSAGVERVLHLSGTTDLRDGPIVLTNNKINQGPEIADHAMALLLSLTRGINKFSAQKDGTWDRASYSGIELNGKTAVVIGVGGIGTQIALRANAFGMEVIGVDPEDKPFLPYVKTIVKPDQLNDVLPKADVVFVSAPHTPKSHKMMGGEQFNLLKQGAYFIAVSRGALYDMDGLVRALDSRRLAGAGVDVTDPEPLPAGHALWKFNNTIITPHVAGQSDKIGGRTTAMIKENIVRFVEGRPMINVVDKQKGY